VDRRSQPAPGAVGTLAVYPRSALAEQTAASGATHGPWTHTANNAAAESRVANEALAMVEAAKRVEADKAGRAAKLKKAADAQSVRAGAQSSYVSRAKAAKLIQIAESRATSALIAAVSQHGGEIGALLAARQEANSASFGVEHAPLPPALSSMRSETPGTPPMLGTAPQVLPTTTRPIMLPGSLPSSAMRPGPFPPSVLLPSNTMGVPQTANGMPVVVPFAMIENGTVQLIGGLMQPLLQQPPIAPLAPSPVLPPMAPAPVLPPMAPPNPVISRPVAPGMATANIAAALFAPLRSAPVITTPT